MWFVLYGILLRLTEGVGWAMTCTTSYALLPALFPSRVATLTVSWGTYFSHSIILLHALGNTLLWEWSGVYFGPSYWQLTCHCKMHRAMISQ